MSSTSTPQRVTRSRSSNHTDTVPAQQTAPGPPVPARDTSIQLDARNLSNPFHVELVIPFSIDLGKGDRLKAQTEIRNGYETLLRALEGEGGLKVATRAGRAKKGDEEIWVFIGAEDEKIDELVDRERLLDEAHNLPPHNHPVPPSPATRIRLLHSLLTSPQIQHGLGITPGAGQWSRVKSVMALHDEAADKAWIAKWMLGGDWRIGVLKDLGDKEASGLGEHQPPPVHLYFDFLTTYTLSLLPLSLVSILFYLFTPVDSYPPLYAFILSLYSTIFVAYWKIKERKLAVRWGTRGCESVAVGQLRPEYVANLGLDRRSGADQGAAIDAIRAGDDLKRDVKVAISVPVITICGAILGCVLMGIFLLEAFVSRAYDGVGKQVVPLLPTAAFVLIVPQIMGLYQTLAKTLVSWEDHPTPVGAEQSLTAKTFSMNAIVAYLQLFLSAYVYAPFGPYIMARVQQHLSHSPLRETKGVKFVENAEKTGLGPRTSGDKLQSIKAGRLKGQLFAYTVTNQVVNTFLELGLPYVMRFFNDWRAGKTTIKEVIHRRDEKDQTPPKNEQDVEKRFLDKVEAELQLPEYSLFTDYAEMVTQFGYVTIWSNVWPLAPVFALINNYFELRTDALKICKHVRRPIGERVETIGAWLQTLGVISWLGAVTNATLLYLFRPSTKLHDQSMNPEIPPTGSVYLHHIVSSFDLSPTVATLLPTLIPLLAAALAASHGFILLRWPVEYIMERVLWRGSPEEIEVQKMTARGNDNIRQEIRQLEEKKYKQSPDGGFWNGGADGAAEIGRLTKTD